MPSCDAKVTATRRSHRRDRRSRPHHRLGTLAQPRTSDAFRSASSTRMIAYLAPSERAAHRRRKRLYASSLGRPAATRRSDAGTPLYSKSTTACCDVILAHSERQPARRSELPMAEKDAPPRPATKRRLPGPLPRRHGLPLSSSASGRDRAPDRHAVRRLGAQPPPESCSADPLAARVDRARGCVCTGIDRLGERGDPRHADARDAAARGAGLTGHHGGSARRHAEVTQPCMRRT